LCRCSKRNALDSSPLGRSVGLHEIAPSSITPRAAKELKRCLWIAVGSFFLTPIALWFFVTGILLRDFSFRHDYLDFYQDLFSTDPDMVFAWLIILAPVVGYQFVLTCIHYYRNPDQIRSIFKFPRR
jgi:hypothetical protein